MRGNDVLMGSADGMVTDSLPGNILSKMLSSACTGGSYEAVGYGYGPGIGKGYDRLVMIISRASGAPVIAGAINYAAQLVRGKYQKIYYGPEEDGPYSLIYNRVLALLLNVDGVENFASLTVNGGTADVTIQAGEIPVLGEVSVT